MEPLPLPNETFSVEQLQIIYTTGSLSDHIQKSIDYITQYYFETSRGMYYFYNPLSESFELRDNKEFTAEVLRKVENDKDIVKYFKTNNKIYFGVSKLEFPRHYRCNGRYYLNHCHGLLHASNTTAYSDYSPEIKAKVERIKEMYKAVWCSNNEPLFQSLMKYFACLRRGLKTQVIIYNQTEAQGNGKSKGVEFVMNYVLGEKVCLLCSTEPLLTQNNKILMGKIWVVFEELPTFTKSQWSGISSKLKTLCTEKTTMFRDLYEKAYEGENICNLIINTNVQSIKDSDGRRIKIMPISDIYKQNFTYWSSLIKDCYNLDVGEAFDAYLLTLDVNDFICQRDIPETEKKALAIATLLNSTEKFLKEYVLTNKEIGRIKPKEFYDKYINFCKTNNLKEEQYLEFQRRLEKLGIVKMKSGTFYYEILLSQLKEIAEREKWLCKYDDIEEPEDPHPKIKIDVKEYEKMKKEIEDLKKQLEYDIVDEL
jgi:hypothetical protein